MIDIETPSPINDLGNISGYNEHCRFISADIASNETLIKMEMNYLSDSQNSCKERNRHNLRGFSIESLPDQ
jgi:hypothetical protein